MLANLPSFAEIMLNNDSHSIPPTPPPSQAIIYRLRTVVANMLLTKKPDFTIIIDDANQ